MLHLTLPSKYDTRYHSNDSTIQMILDTDTHATVQGEIILISAATLKCITKRKKEWIHGGIDGGKMYSKASMVTW